MSESIEKFGLDWKDTTTYSRGEERNPTCWTTNIGTFRLTVISSHVHYRGIWIGHCEPFFRERELKAQTRDEAMKNALLLIREPITEAYKSLARIKVKT